MVARLKQLVSGLRQRQGQGQRPNMKLERWHLRCHLNKVMIWSSIFFVFVLTMLDFGLIYIDNGLVLF